MRPMLRTNRVQPIQRVQTGVGDATGLSTDSLMRSAHAESAVRLAGALCPPAVLSELLLQKEMGEPAASRARSEATVAYSVHLRAVEQRHALSHSH